jgi:predicted GNAT family N-acyltransferase
MSLSIRPVRDAADWAAATGIRREVFIVEQACPPELEWDAHDGPDRRGVSVHHLLAWDGTRAVGVARWRTATLDGSPAAKVERVAVLPDTRGRGIARQIVSHALDDARRAGYSRFVLHAQRHLSGFYASFGFVPAGDPFDEAGIEHVKMTLTEE